MLDERRRQLADAVERPLDVELAVRAAADVDGDRGERFVERDERVGHADDAAPVAERLVERLADGDADVLDGVVLVDVEVARSP